MKSQNSIVLVRKPDFHREELPRNSAFALFLDSMKENYIIFIGHENISLLLQESLLLRISCSKYSNLDLLAVVSELLVICAKVSSKRISGS